MSDIAAASSADAGSSAGSLLRAAREKQGLHIAALAAAIKVVPKKLELLEADRLDELPDATFARALAQTVCRALKIDPAPVLERLPPPAGHRLEHVSAGLNMQFRERPGAVVLREPADLFASPAFWIVSLILLAAVVIYVVPGRFIGLGKTGADGAAQETVPATVSGGEVQPGGDGTSAAGLSSTDVVSDAASSTSIAASQSTPKPVVGMAPDAVLPGSDADGGSVPPTAAPAASAVVAPLLPEATGLLKLRPSTPSWVGVVDARGKSLVSRLVAGGEAIGVDGEPPFKVTIGNAAGTEVVFRDQPVALPAVMRDGVARLVLK